jgi:hypothetical protein
MSGTSFMIQFNMDRADGTLSMGPVTRRVETRR